MQITVARMCHATLEAIEEGVMDTVVSASGPFAVRGFFFCLNVGEP